MNPQIRLKVGQCRLDNFAHLESMRSENCCFFVRQQQSETSELTKIINGKKIQLNIALDYINHRERYYSQRNNLRRTTKVKMLK